jgi:RNA-directed DNA polymerase
MIEVSVLLSQAAEQLTEQFFALRTPRDVARLLHVDYSRLVYHLYKVPTDRRYVTFQVPKRSGGSRRISAPATALKIIQQKLNQVLQCVYQPKASVHGFVRGRSILTNASKHTRKNYVLNIDLIDFFPSINFGRVRGMFMAVPYELHADVATVLAQICCFDNELPQGAPTSPIVSNMICARMDSQLQRLAREHRCHYTRYADDMTFSTRVLSFPSALASIDANGRVHVGHELSEAVHSNGFSINPKKVRLRTKYRRQQVTGLTVNKKANVDRRYVRRVRAMLHAWEKYGLEAAEHEFLTRHDVKHRNPEQDPPSFASVVRGRIEFLGMVRGRDDVIYQRFMGRFWALAPGLPAAPIDEVDAALRVHGDLAEPDKRGDREASGESLFINYRRDDSSGWAVWLYDKLKDQFGPDRVFKDVERIQPGADWLNTIDGALSSTRVLLAVIGRNWLTVMDETGSRRLDNPEDLVRREIERAIERDILLIPVLVDGASMPRDKDLPESMLALRRRQAHEISSGRRDYDLSKLIAQLEQVVGPGRASDPTTLEGSVVRDQSANLFYIDDSQAAYPVPDDATAAFFAGRDVEKEISRQILEAFAVEEPLESVIECELLYLDPGPHIYALIGGRTKYVGMPELTRWHRQQPTEWRHVSQEEFDTYPSWD